MTHAIDVPNELRRLLEAKLSEALAADAGRAEIVIANAADELDRLQQHVSREIAIRNLERQSQLIKGIRAAMEHIKDGTYGVCLRCDEPIPEKRLKAVPWAAYCVVCQETLDRQPREAGSHKT